MSKYILIGIPNCGKSTLGRRAADFLQLPFFDTDVMASESLGIKNFAGQFRANIDGSFVRAQRNAFFEILALESDAVIATGAEAALIPDCAVFMRRKGTVIHIQRDQEVILADVANDSRRMILKDVNNGKEIDMQAHTVKLYAEEIPQYVALAHLTIDNNGTEEEGLEKLVALIQSQTHK